MGLAWAAEAADGVAPLAEEVLHRTRGDNPSHDDLGRVTHLLARDPAGRLVGYGQVHRPEPDAATAELVVHPQARRHGLGRGLATALLAEARPAAAGPIMPDPAAPDPGPTGPAAPDPSPTGPAAPDPSPTGPAAPDPGPTGQIVPAPAVEAVSRPPVSLRVWAHGDHPGAQALARSLGFARTRVLHQLRRPLLAPIPAPVLPAGVTLRPFRPGADEADWLAVNARAFADHPEQGQWTADDLRWRLAEPWFDPAGFLLAVRPEPAPEQLLGFHWTKIHQHPDRHPGTDSQPHSSPTAGHNPSASAGQGPSHNADHDHGPPVGEVYVLGVDPAAHGLGLGTALTLAGLRHLRERGLSQVMLYVDDSNQAALTLYRKLGFAPWSVDVTYTHPG